MTTPGPIPSGTLFVISDGEYSDYSTLALCRAMRDIDPTQAAQEYLAEHQEQAGDYNFQPYEFIAWLIANGYAVEEDWLELHVGAYSTLEPTCPTHEPLSYHLNEIQRARELKKQLQAEAEERLAKRLETEGRYCSRCETKRLTRTARPAGRFILVCADCGTEIKNLA